MVHVTKHVLVRMSQRGLTNAMVKLVLKYGVIVHDKVVLRRKELVKLVEGLDGSERATGLKLLDKGGAVVVETDGVLATAYNYDSYDRRRRGRGREAARRPRGYR